MTSTSPHRVLVAGGGVAGLEAMLAVRELAGEHVAVTLLSPDDAFRLEALSVEDPFARPAPRRYELERLCAAAGADLVSEGLAAVDVAARVVTTTGGHRIAFDDLVVAIGAQRRLPYAGGVTFRGMEDAEAIHGLVQDVEIGAVQSVVFVVPSGTAWPLPLYELALLVAERATTMGVAPGLTFVTPEERPLGVFGLDSSALVSGLLRDAGIELHTSLHVRDLDRGTALGIDGTPIVHAQRAVTVPLLTGTPVPGLPADPDGFLPVDDRGAVLGAPGVWAAGDGTTFPLKQGGIAAQQAGAAAASIAAAAGADVEPVHFRPHLHATLFTGARPAHLGEVSRDDDAKVATVYLARALEQLDRGAPA
jgi:sulfide:quinone oxidoreductase